MTRIPEKQSFNKAASEKKTMRQSPRHHPAKETCNFERAKASDLLKTFNFVLHFLVAEQVLVALRLGLLNEVLYNETTIFSENSASLSS